MKQRIIGGVVLAIVAVIMMIVRQQVVEKETSTATSVTTTAELTTTTARTTPILQPTDDIISEQLSIQRGNITLYGVVTASRNYKNEKRPLLVMAHGFNNTLEMNENYAEHLAKLGYVVYRFDFYGGSRQSKSGGTDMLSMSVLTEKQDLKAVVDYLVTQSFVDENEISLLGVSQGGVVSTLYAAEYPEQIKNLVLLFPAFILFDDVKETYRSLGVTSMDQIPAVITHRNSRLGAIYLQDALGVDIYEEISKVVANVLIVHGTNDSVVPYSYAQDANERFAHSELVTVQNGGHWLDEKFNQVAFPAINTFLKK